LTPKRKREGRRRKGRRKITQVSKDITKLTERESILCT
jgi:hypothetical protein